MFLCAHKMAVMIILYDSRAKWKNQIITAYVFAFEGDRKEKGRDRA